MLDASDDILKGVVLTADEEREERRNSIFRASSRT